MMARALVASAAEETRTLRTSDPEVDTGPMPYGGRARAVLMARA